MKIIKNIHGSVELWGIITVACIFTFTLFFIRTYFYNQNNLNGSVLGTTCVSPFSKIACNNNRPCCIGNCIFNKCYIFPFFYKKIDTTPTPYLRPTPSPIIDRSPSPTMSTCIYPNGYGCSSTNRRCCTGSCFNDKCVTSIPIPPTAPPATPNPTYKRNAQGFCVLPGGIGCHEDLPCCTGLCVDRKCVDTTPTNIPKSTPTPYKDCPLVPIQQPCEILPGCIWINGKCYSQSSKSLPTPTVFKTTSTSDSEEWKTVISDYFNYSYNYPESWGKVYGTVSPSFSWLRRSFKVNVYEYYNVNDIEKFLEIFDAQPENARHIYSNRHIASVGPYKGIVREENWLEYSGEFKTLSLYFIGPNHIIFNPHMFVLYEIGPDPVVPPTITDADRQLFNKVISTFKVPHDPNSTKPINKYWSKGCTSFYGIGCMASGKCCYGKCKTDKCLP